MNDEDVNNLIKSIETLKAIYHKQMTRIAQLEKLIELKDIRIKELELQNKNLVLYQGAYTRLTG